jgi:hypothetical protein
LKKLFLYLLANFFLLVVLGFFISYVLLSNYIDNPDQSDGKFMQFLAVLMGILSMHISLLLSLSSITIFLNLIPFVHKHWFLSFVSFCGISLGYLIFMFCKILVDGDPNWESFFMTTKPVLIILTTQFVLTFLSFIVYRFRLKRP